MTVKIMLDEGAYIPTRAHKTDAGMDLYARIEAQKDFAERLKEHMCSYDFSNYHYFKAIDEDTLDEVLKEMTEVSNGK